MNPRLIRAGKAPTYLGMDTRRFNAEVRPQLTEIPIGIQGIAFDRLELDAWVDQYIAAKGRRKKGGISCRNLKTASSYGATRGTLINGVNTHQADEFEAALERARKVKRENT